MKDIKEHDVVKITREIDADILGSSEQSVVCIPEGALGTVIHIYYSNQQPTAFELEFCIEWGKVYSIATVSVNSIESIDTNETIGHK